MNMASSTNTGDATKARKMRALFKETAQGVFPTTMSSFSELTLDAATKAALTAANGKLVVEMDAAGTRVLLADSRTNQLIGGPEDLQRLGGIRTFVNRERKNAAGIEVARETVQTAYKATLAIASVQPGYLQGPLDSAYGAALRPLLSAIHTTVENKQKLIANVSSDDRETFFPVLKAYFNGIEDAIAVTMCALTMGESIKGKLAEELFNRGVPDWVFNRFSSKNFVLERSQSLHKVLFPSDPSKGLALSVKEWLDDDFCMKQKFILGNSYLVFALLRSEELLRAMTKLEASVSFSDETNPVVAKLLKVKVVVVPAFETADYVREIGGKSRGGWKFPTPGFGTETSAIQSISVAILRLYSANFQSVDLVNDFYKIIAPGAVSKAAVTPTNNFYVQWGNHPTPDGEWLKILRNGGLSDVTRRAVWRWLRTELRLSEESEGGKALASALKMSADLTMQKYDEDRVETPEVLDDNGNVVKPAVTKTVTMCRLASAPISRRRFSDTVESKTVTIILGELSAVQKAQAQAFGFEKFPVRKKTGTKKSTALGSRLTRLSPDAKSLCDEVAERSPHLASQLGEWLRGFSDLRTQIAAVKLANASFDELFVEEIDDEESVQPDWAEQEDEN